jgi:hypothetical protein
MVQICKNSRESSSHVGPQNGLSNKISLPGSRWLNVLGLPAVAVGGAPLTVRRFSNSCCISRAAAFALKPEPGHVVALYLTSSPQHLDDGTRAIPKYTRTYIKGLSLSTRGRKGQCRITSGSDSHRVITVRWLTAF